MNGFKKESENLTEIDYTKRYDACKKCVFFTAKKLCLKCHCFMPIKIKIKNSKCPLGKW